MQSFAQSMHLLLHLQRMQRSLGLFKKVLSQNHLEVEGQKKTAVVGSSHGAAYLLMVNTGFRYELKPLLGEMVMVRAAG
jgi:hypothetical protein